MFKVCEIRASALLQEDWTGQEDFLLYGVSDPEAPEDHTLIFVKGALAESCGQVRNSIFITKEGLELSLAASSIQLQSSSPKNLYGELLERIVRMLPEADRQMVNGSCVSRDVKMVNIENMADYEKAMGLLK